MTEYTIHPLVVGANATDQGIMTYLKGYGKRIWIPIYVFYLEGGPEKILVDTGLEQFVVPPEVETEYGLKIQEFEDALANFCLNPRRHRRHHPYPSAQRPLRKRLQVHQRPGLRPETGVRVFQKSPPGGSPLFPRSSG